MSMLTVKNLLGEPLFDRISESYYRGISIPSEEELRKIKFRIYDMKRDGQGIFAVGILGTYISIFYGMIPYVGPFIAIVATTICLAIVIFGFERNVIASNLETFISNQTLNTGKAILTKFTKNFPKKEFKNDLVKEAMKGTIFSKYIYKNV